MNNVQVLSRIETWMAVGLTLLLGGFYCLPEDSKWLNNIFYLGVLIPACWLIFSHYTVVVKNSLFCVVFAVLLYNACSSLWGLGDQPASFLKSSKYILYICSYIFAIAWLYQYQERFWWLVRGFLLLASISVIINIVYWVYIDHGYGRYRLTGPIAFENQVDLGVAYGFATLMGLVLWVKSARHRWFALLCVLVLMVGMLLTETRTAILAFIIAGGVLLINAKKTTHWKGLMLILCVIIAAWSAANLHRIEMVNSHPARFLVWQAAITMAEQPLIGIGMHTPYKIDAKTIGFLSTTHSQYVGAVLLSGWIGLMLMLMMMFYALRVAWRSNNEVGLALLAYGAIASLTHGTGLLAHPKDNWLYWWFAFAVIIAYPMRELLVLSRAKNEVNQTV